MLPPHRDGTGSSSTALEPMLPAASRHDEESLVENTPTAEEVLTAQRNIRLLLVTTTLFSGFAVAEVFGAIAGNSLSLLGDAMSMVVDAVTYLFNMLAERQKAKGVTERRRLQLEVFVPLFSVVALLATSVYIIVGAAATIAAPPSDGGNTNEAMMLGFSITNLIIDIVCVTCFAQASKLFGFRTHEQPQTDDGRETDVRERERANTNLCSAYTHVLADTLRSVAVLVAAAISLKDKSINSSVADAWAAVVVSVIIFASVVPLVQALVHKCRVLRHQ